MNGQLSKRIRLAAAISGKAVKLLKREYRAMPYHHRKLAGIEVKPHKAAIRRLRHILGS